MALLLITGADGRAHLVHSSAFDAVRPPRLGGSWSEVWAKIDANGARADLDGPTTGVVAQNRKLTGMLVRAADLIHLDPGSRFFLLRATPGRRW